VIKDATAASGLSLSLLYRLKKQGKLRMVRVGGRTLIPADELERLISEGSK
jgi:excisionase family DNA binding protein